MKKVLRKNQTHPEMVLLSRSMGKAPIQSRVNILMVGTAVVSSWQSYRCRIMAVINLKSEGTFTAITKNESIKI